MKKLFIFFLLLFPASALAQTQINVALASVGATTTASSSYNTAGITFPSANGIKGDRADWCGVGQSCGGGPANGWASANGSSAPQWLEVDFPVSRTLSEIDTFEVQDSPASPGTTPTLSTTCSTFCNTAFEVQTWNGSMWVDIPGGNISGNTHVWNQFTGLSISTTKIRYYINTSPGGIFGLVDFEAYYTHPAGSVTFNAPSCNEGDVIGEVGITLDGDTVLLPSGSCNWSGVGVPVPSNIGITIMGAGTPTSDPSKFVPDSSCSGGSNTTINISAGIVIGATPAYGASTMRVSCMTLNATSNAVGIRFDGTCTLSGCPNIRIDNIHFTGWGPVSHPNNSFGINAIAHVFGVIDHNQVDGDGHFLAFAEVQHAQFPDYFGGGAGVGISGDNSWANPEYYGTNRFLFYENNTLNDAGCCENENVSLVGVDHVGGSRVVSRFNIHNISDVANSVLDWHGTESNGRGRGGRAFEFYKNSWFCTGGIQCATPVSIRSGTGMDWGNTFDICPTCSLSTLENLNTFRSYANPNIPNIWGACDGLSIYDTNDAGSPFYTDTVASVSNPTITVTGSPGWTPGQWGYAMNPGAPYSLHDSDTNSGNGSGTEITDNGSNTLTLNQANTGVPGGSWFPAMGDHIKIGRATACIDQGGGRGAGFKYTGGSGVSPTPAQSSAQILSPAYTWLNPFPDKTTCTSGACVVFAQTARQLQNRDFYFETTNQATNSGCPGSCTPFNGGGGIGHGPRSQRPTDTTNGDAYWSTTGSGTTWNNGAADSGCLDIVQSGAWSNCVYTPYVYPHPLDSSSTPAPPAATSSGSNLLMMGAGIQ